MDLRVHLAESEYNREILENSSVCAMIGSPRENVESMYYRTQHCYEKQKYDFNSVDGFD